jgi:hypothetical protein
MKRVFIGGMGRSGTTIALNALYQHGELAAIPIETKFLVEADGFAELLEAVTLRYSTASTPLAYARFLDLMTMQVTGRTPSPFRDQHDLSSNIFRHYDEALGAMTQAMVSQRYFPQREDMLALVRAFVDATFDDLARISNKPGWVEKTPANMFRFNFLREAWPDSYFVHLLRDPRMIMISLLEKGWIERDLAFGLPFFRDMIAALTDARARMLDAPRVLEVRLEQLEADPATTLADLAARLDLRPFAQSALDGVAAKITAYHANKQYELSPFAFDAAQAEQVNAVLLPYVRELGYPDEFPRAGLQDGVSEGRTA